MPNLKEAFRDLEHRLHGFVDEALVLLKEEQEWPRPYRRRRRSGMCWARCRKQARGSSMVWKAVVRRRVPETERQEDGYGVIEGANTDQG